MVSFVLEKLKRPWVERVLLAVGPNAEPYRGLDVELVEEPEPLGTGGPLRLLHKELGEHTLVLNGDTLLSIDLEAFYRAHLTGHSSVTLAVVKKRDTSRYGRVEFDEERRITQFSEKGLTGAGWVNAGAYLFRRQARQELPGLSCFSLERDYFPTLSPHEFRAWPSAGDFQDLGTPKAYLEANLQQSFIHSSAVLEGATIAEHVRIGPRCRVGVGSHLERCFLEQDVIVGEGCRISDCILTAGVVVAPRAVLHQQIVVRGEQPVWFGKGSDE